MCTAGHQCSQHLLTHGHTCTLRRRVPETLRAPSSPSVTLSCGYRLPGGTPACRDTEHLAFTSVSSRKEVSLHLLRAHTSEGPGIPVPPQAEGERGEGYLVCFSRWETRPCDLFCVHRWGGQDAEPALAGSSDPRLSAETWVGGPGHSDGALSDEPQWCAGLYIQLMSSYQEQKTTQCMTAFRWNVWKGRI